MNELPDWNFPFVDNYTGPWWSDGKIQRSVADGQSRPKSKVDVLSRKHDAEYFYCRSDECLDLADLDYYEATRGMSFVPRMIGDAVLYVNRAGRRPNLRGSGGVKMSSGDEPFRAANAPAGTYFKRGDSYYPNNATARKTPDVTGFAPAVMPARFDASPSMPVPLSNPPSFAYPAATAAKDPPTMDVTKQAGNALVALDGAEYVGGGFQAPRSFLTDFFGPEKKNKNFFTGLFGPNKKYKKKNKNKNRVFAM